MECKVQTAISNCHVQYPLKHPNLHVCIGLGYLQGICMCGDEHWSHRHCMYAVYGISPPVTVPWGASAAALRSLTMGSYLYPCNRQHLHIHSAQAGLSGALVGLGSGARMGIRERPRVKPESKPGYQCILLLYLLLLWEFCRNATALHCVCQGSQLATMR